MYIINNRPNNKKIIYIIVVISIMIFCLICFLVWNLSNFNKNKPEKESYSGKAQIFLNLQKAFAKRNNIQINTEKTKIHPNKLYKELVYEDGSFFKISEKGKIQQVYRSFEEYVDPKRYELLFYDENEYLIKLIKRDRFGYIIKDYSPNPQFDLAELMIPKERPNKTLKLTKLKLDWPTKSPYRRVNMKVNIPDNPDKIVNCIYNSNEVIYGLYKDGLITKLINPYSTYISVDKNNGIIKEYNIDSTQEQYLIREEIFKKIRVGDTLTTYNSDTQETQNVTMKKLEPAGSYFVLHLTNERTLSNVLDNENDDDDLNCEKIDIIKGTDRNYKIPVELQYQKRTNSNDNPYSYTFGDGTIEKYDKNGQLESVEYLKEKIIFSYNTPEYPKQWSFRLIDSDLQPIIPNNNLKQ